MVARQEGPKDKGEEPKYVQRTLWEDSPAVSPKPRPAPSDAAALGGLTNSAGSEARHDLRSSRRPVMAQPVKLLVLLTSSDPEPISRGATRIECAVVSRLVKDHNERAAKAGGAAIAIHKVIVPQGERIQAVMNRTGVTDPRNVVGVASDKWGINSAAMRELLSLGGRVVAFLNGNNLERGYYSEERVTAMHHPAGRQGYGIAIRAIAHALFGRR